MFDYKNKYAIIEYINDIASFINTSGKKTFRILILTHNFDFYRTLASRITKPGNSYILPFRMKERLSLKKDSIQKIFLAITRRNWKKERMIIL